MQMQHPNVVTDAWARTKTPCEQILPLVLTFFDHSPLSVLELTALAGANRHFNQMHWPRWTILYDLDSPPLDFKSLDSKLERLGDLGERVRSPASEEDRCRAAWALAVLLNSCSIFDWEDSDKLVRLLASGLVAPAPWASMSTASAIAQLVGGCDTKLHNLLAEVGVAAVLVQLVQHTSPLVQQVALKAIAYAGICPEEGDSLILGIATNAIPTISSIARAACYVNQLEAVRAIKSLAEGSNLDQLKVFIPDVLEFLVHERHEMKEVAATALLALMLDRKDLKIIACEHGCIPKLVDGCWRSTGLCQDYLLTCLHLISIEEACQQMAVQHGILPLLFQLLQDRNIMTDRTRQEQVFHMLLVYSHHARSAFLQESQGCRTSAIRHITWIAEQLAHPNSTSAFQLLPPGVLA